MVGGEEGEGQRDGEKFREHTKHPEADIGWREGESDGEGSKIYDQMAHKS